MANEVENIVSNMSYTNKDFIAVYTELLDLFRKLTLKYDPSLSNESDPGVILTKLNALIADKLNYNIDKNALETFPVSVTQESNARNLFSELGYRMKWYRSATTPITFAYNGDTEENTSITLPRFTMVSDVENEIVYTTVEEASIPADKTKTIEVPAVQGIAVEYELNGSKVIKFSSLDADRKLYFTDPMVAENGIFICNDTNGSPSNNYGEWVMVDNMAVCPTNTTEKYYEFGVTRDGTPFLQFSEVADRQFKDGIHITYLKTMGLEGNVKSKILSHFFNTVTATKTTVNGGSQETSSISLTDENTKITNTLNAIDGADKETIDESYNNYKKTIGVFKTLVALRDYMDYINSLDVVSNSFVCDRTDDVQDSYKALMNNDGQISYYTYVDEGGSPSAPLMSAFDLKLYCLNYAGTPTNGTQYNETFLMLNPNSALLNKVKTLIEDVKSIQHDYKNIEEDKICYLINSFPLGIRIIPHSKVTALQARWIVANVVTALFKNFNAKEVNFGEAASYDKIYSTILSADPLIKTAVLDDIVYDTHACYFEKVGTDYILHTDLIVSGDTPSVQHIGTVAGTTFTKTDGNAYHAGDLCYATNTHKVYVSKSGSTTVEENRDSLSSNFKFEIYAKSVLNGNSPLLVKDDKFDYALTQSFIGQYDGISTITTDTILDFGAIPLADDNFVKLKQNEGVVFYIPSYEVTEEYSTYVAIETNIHHTEGGTEVYGLLKNRRTLGSGEKVILYWKESDDDSNYHYRSFAEGSVIEPTNEIRCYYGNSLIGGNLPVGEGVVTNFDTNSDIKTKLYRNNSVLSGTTALKVLRQIKVGLPHNSQKCYWVLNKKTPKTEGNNVVMKYVLFETDQEDYILQNGEYFFYTNPSMTSLNILYPGTRISRSIASVNDTLTEWSCTVANNDEFENITTEGASAISNDIWQLIPSNFNLSCEEMQMFSVSGEGAKVKIMNGQQTASIVLNSSVQSINGDFDITIVAPDGTSETLPKAVGGDAKVYGNSFLSYISSPTTPMVLSSERQSVLFEGFKHTVTSSEGSSHSFTYSVQGLDVGSVKIGNVSYEVVASSPVSGESVAVTYLNGTATLTFNSSDSNFAENAVVSIGIGTGGYEDSPYYILSDDDYSIVGGKDIDVTRAVVSATDISYEKMSAYVYQEADMGDIENYTAEKIPLVFDSNTSSYEIEFKIPEGNYVVPLTNPTNGVFGVGEVSATVTIDGASSSVVDIFNGSDFSGYGTYYLKLHSDGTHSITLTIEETATLTSSYILTLGQLYKYTDNGNFDSPIALQAMIDKVTSLDSAHKFDYTYKIPVDSLIENPLDGESFTNEHHPYNKYTICEIDVSSLNDIKVNNLRT